MEQRNGRVDRLYSLAERRFANWTRRKDPTAEDLIQVQIPYLPDTVEVLQVRRVLEGMFRFVDLMHDDHHDPQKRIFMDEEFVKGTWEAPSRKARLKTTFEVRQTDLDGPDLPDGFDPEAQGE